ncbi:hypothetical protein BO79DRAFT_274168 [Aspergillus costaricaensis CBS 115574]|uniref:Uncharacterized protein n=1 Tax=Aspergillus costaricaensis CBS 115574 TaxID=1448317 RepID=A0ACD1I2X9_9EURO|nr:hypothetical protein BO79DRAFT_274168 [Aspergillus costaricaensis CBS 115574]RAK84826.1 hypothetical protein BO79DRAFT_274168 [Aspergillus costaricaensis CBS 115574]
MAYADPVNCGALSAAFTIADSLGFRLFFSFDYAGNGPWPEDEVLDYINTCGSNSAYYQYNGQPLVSTFEGPNNSDDWVGIKKETNCFLIPDWSSLGAKAAMKKGGPQEMNTYVDASYRDYLSGLPYMMPVSPWFYTNLPGYNKNWMWRSDNLWYDRWQEVWYLQPEFVEILTWNDYGESHYIGPIYEKALSPMHIGEAPFNYVENMPHDGWRLFLPFVIDMYKQNVTTVTQEGLVTWFRPQPIGACDGGNTTINTASQLEIKFDPASVLTDKIFLSALLGSSADISITVGGSPLSGVTWMHKPSGGVGIYHGSATYTGTGAVVVTINRNGETIAEVTEGSISATCNDGFQNWNAWVGSASSSNTISAKPPSLSNDTCVEGTGTGNFAGLCEYSCQYGHCPVGACYCTKMGPAATLPNATNTIGYPAAGEDANYSGLCSFDCNYGYCPDGACGTVDVPLSAPTSSPFTPSACVAGEGEGGLAGLCSYACNYGYCPINSCTCTAEGVLIDAPAANSSLTGVPADNVDYNKYHGLCDFACSRGYCPEGACVLSSNAGSSSSSVGHDSGSSSSSTSNATVVYIDSGVWSNPDASCEMPCTMVLPDITLTTTTTITRPPYTTTVEVQWTTTTRWLNLPWSPFLFTTTGFPVSNLVLHTGGTYLPTPRLPPTTVTIDDDPNPLDEPGVTHTPRNRTIIIPPYPWDTSVYGSSSSRDDDLVLPKPPSIVITDGPTSPKCPGKCSGTVCNDLFCNCSWDCPHTGYSYDSDTSSGKNSDGSDGDSGSSSGSSTNKPGSDNNGDDTSSSGSSSGSSVNNGPDPNAGNDDTNEKQTATETSTSSESCYSVSPDDDQGEDGGAWPDSILSSIRSSGWPGLASAMGITTDTSAGTHTQVIYSGTASALTRTTATTTTASKTSTSSSTKSAPTSTKTALPKYGTSSAWALFLREVDSSSGVTYTLLAHEYEAEGFAEDHCTMEETWMESVNSGNKEITSLTGLTV